MTTPPSGNCTLTGGVRCAFDSDCTDGGPNGRCIANPGGALICLCTYDACNGDTGCATNTTCACHGSPYMNADGNRCVPSDCRVDTDCGPCGWCSPSPSTTTCGLVVGYYCHTAHDQCVNDSDCRDGSAFGACAYDTSAGNWRCEAEVPCQ